jgi:hypothetical protein
MKGLNNRRMVVLLKRAFEMSGLMRLVSFVLLIARLFERRMAGLAGKDIGYEKFGYTGYSFL